MTTTPPVPQGNTGDILNWPMLKIVYRTDPDKIAALLPPGIEPGANANVNLTIYNFPVPDEPEYGIVTSVDADYNGTPGEYTLGYGIDQESAIFVSQRTNGQPKYPESQRIQVCSHYRLCILQGRVRIQHGTKVRIPR